jgi:hypothetical protein
MDRLKADAIGTEISLITMLYFCFNNKREKHEKNQEQRAWESFGGSKNSGAFSRRLFSFTGFKNHR